MKLEWLLQPLESVKTVKTLLVCIWVSDLGQVVLLVSGSRFPSTIPTLTIHPRSPTAARGDCCPSGHYFNWVCHLYFSGSKDCSTVNVSQPKIGLFFRAKFRTLSWSSFQIPNALKLLVEREPFRQRAGLVTTFEHTKNYCASIFYFCPSAKTQLLTRLLYIAHFIGNSGLSYVLW